jgi:hypothetical protein
MNDKTEPREMTVEELEALEGEELPARESMSLISPNVARPMPLEADPGDFGEPTEA